MTDTKQAFAAALDRYARISRTSDADEPRSGARTRRDEASRAVADARHAMVAEHGPAATAATEADAELREARRLLDAAHAAREAGLRADELPALIERERLAVAHAEATAGPAHAEAEAMASRIALESDHAEELAAIGAQLGQAARQAVVAAEVARRAFEALDGAESAYGRLLQEARERLKGAGFDHSMTFGGELHPTTTGPTLRVAGVAWPEPERLGLMPVTVCARVAERLRPVAAEPTDAPLPALTAA